MAPVFVHGVVIALVLAAAPPSLDAQTEPARVARPDADLVSVDALLARPPSPGGLLLLVPHASAAEVQQRWREAARHENPQVRAAAARAILASGLVHLLPVIQQALEEEKDEYAAIEQTRALVALGDARAVDATIAEARCFGGGVHAVVAGALALKAPDDLLARAPALTGRMAASDLGSALGLAASSRRAEQASAFAGAARATGPRGWAAFLDFAEQERIAVPTAVLLQALEDSSPDIVRRSMWSLGRSSGVGRPPGTEVLAALDRALERLAEPRSPEAFLRAMLGRIIKEDRPDAIDWPDAISAWPRERAASIRQLTRLAHIASKSERKALAKVLDVEDWPGVPIPTAAEPSPGEPVDFPESLTVVLRTPTAFPRHAVSDAMAIVGCAASADALAVADIHYGPDGRPRRVRTSGRGLSPGCDQLVRALMPASVAPVDGPLAPERPQIVVMSLRPEILACADQDPPYPPLRSVEKAEKGDTSTSRIVPPKKTHHVNPVYPEAMLQARLTGRVIVEAIISRTGCVSFATVKRSPDAHFSLAALLAVTQWRFSPTLLDGSPVRVVMTVTTNFSLK